MQSLADLQTNLRKMESATERAAKQGSRLVVFPEMAYFSAPLADCKAITDRYAELTATFANWAKIYQLCLLPGTLREPATSGLHYNTLLAFDPQGKQIAQYRKIFLFKACLPDRTYHEGSYTEAGNQVAVFDFESIRFGLAICYDLRFPELFRSLKKKGAEVVFLPAAFTVPTGRAHWETLLRARAIENQFYVAAPGLSGRSGNGAHTYGHSLVVDAWGKVRACAANRATTITFRYEHGHASDCRSKVDAWASRREDFFPIP